MTQSMSHAASAEPNLTPLLDMVFQLITFFMLVINFKSAAMDLSLKLPVVGSAGPVDTRGQEDLLILNIDSAGQLIVYGVPEDIPAYIADAAKSSAAAARRANPKYQVGDDLPTTVVVRADRDISFGLLNVVIKECQTHGYRKFALKTVNRQEAAP